MPDSERNISMYVGIMRVCIYVYAHTSGGMRCQAVSELHSCMCICGIYIYACTHGGQRERYIHITEGDIYIGPDWAELQRHTYTLCIPHVCVRVLVCVRAPSPTVSPTDPVPRGLMTLCPGAD